MTTTDSEQALPARVVDAHAGEWAEHPRFAGVLLKGLLTGADNALASVNVVRLPAGHEIPHHTHPKHVETAYVLSGAGMFWLGETEVPFRAGQIVAVPMGTVHGLRNPSHQDMELLSVFTPPLS
jgi:quercetin dioxygenase-like cupin family protein